MRSSFVKLRLVLLLTNSQTRHDILHLREVVRSRSSSILLQAAAQLQCPPPTVSSVRPLLVLVQQGVCTRVACQMGGVLQNSEGGTFQAREDHTRACMQPLQAALWGAATSAPRWEAVVLLG